MSRTPSTGAFHEVPIAPTPGTAKAFGAFYTDARVAAFLVSWAIRTPRDTVVDPSFGGGVFLQAAFDRLTHLGGDAAHQVFGIEIDPGIHARVAQLLADTRRLPAGQLTRQDFFRLDASPVWDVVVGNPPFIRYQRFTGEARQKALARAAGQGVTLSGLCSSWAPFLVHAVAMLQRGGRLAMVIPVELGHAAYALPVLEFLRRSFASITFLTFRRKLFPDLAEDTLLLLAEDRGAPFAGFFRCDLADADALAGSMESIEGREALARDGRDLERLDADALARGGRDLERLDADALARGGRNLERLDADALARGDERLLEYAVPAETRALYRRLIRRADVRRLGELADVGIGYVTGANDFFHLEPAEALRLGIADRYLRPAVRRSRALIGLRFTLEDWQKAAEQGDAGHLLYLEKGVELDQAVRHYLEQGTSHGVDGRYKCRVRDDWYRVPHVHMPDAFLTYMSGRLPRLVANEAAAVTSNTLHVLRRRPGVSIPATHLAAWWLTSLTRLSCELEGHALGGGMLKLEPSEAERVAVATPHLEPDVMEALVLELDREIRAGELERAQAQADAVLLEQGLGLSGPECQRLRSAAELLRERRHGRG